MESKFRKNKLTVAGCSTSLYEISVAGRWKELHIYRVIFNNVVLCFVKYYKETVWISVIYMTVDR